MSTSLSRLQEWYRDQCDGVWEHSWGVKVDTLDNPGWKLSIDLIGTRYEGETWPEIKIDNGESDWLFCQIKDGHFECRGDPLKLDKMLSQFFAYVEKSDERYAAAGRK